MQRNQARRAPARRILKALAGIAAVVPLAPGHAQNAEASTEAESPPSLASTLAVPGVIPRIEVTGLVGQRVAGDGADETAWTGRADLYVDFSSEGMGLWKGTVLRTHLEWRESETGAFSQGFTLLPTNTAGFLPITGKGFELTSLYIAQQLGPATNLLVGKINAVDLLDTNPFFGGMGTRRFQHIAFVAPPSGVMPPTFMGAVLAHQAGAVAITAMVFDPDDRSADYWIDDLFENGVNLSLGGTWGGAVSGRPTTLGFTATYSTKRGQDFEDLLLPPDVPRSLERGSYNIALQASHLLVPSQADPNKGLGFYVQAAFADGNPNVIRSSVAGGLAGYALIPGRERDSFGLGGFYYDFSNILQDVTTPFVDFDDEAGIEAWYSFGFGPYTRLVLDAQLIDPAAGGADTAFVLGARLQFAF